MEEQLKIVDGVLQGGGGFPVVRRGGALPLPRATARVAPTEGYKRRGEVRNPPVTASPCQPPLGKGAKGTGDADCHSQCAHWLRNDRGVYKGCGASGQIRILFFQKKQTPPRLPPRTMLCTAIPPCFAARSRETASRSAATLLRCHGRPRSDLKPPCDPRPDGSGAMFPHPFRARFHLLRLSLAA